jgi:hypothetical protein
MVQVKLWVAARLLALTVRVKSLHELGAVQIGVPFTKCVGLVTNGPSV